MKSGRNDGKESDTPSDTVVSESVNQPSNPLRILNTDSTLYLFSFLNKKEVLNVCLTNKENAKILTKPKFWQQRAATDHHMFIAPNIYAKDVYSNDFRPSHIKKIIDMYYFTVGIDRSGHLHVLDESFDRHNEEATNRLALITNFVKDKQVLDMYVSDGGTWYIRTTTGLYGVGSNFHGQLGNKYRDYSLDDIHLVQPANQGEKILQSDCGMNYSLVRTANQLTVRGKMLHHTKNLLQLPAENIVDVRCSYTKAYALKRNAVLMEVSEEGLTQVRQFLGKKVKEVQTKGKQTMLRCSDGIYVDGDSSQGKLGLAQDQVTFTKLDFFNDKTIYSVNLGSCHMIVHCKEGVYVAGMNNVGRLGLGDYVNRLSFTRLDINPNKVTNMHLTTNSFLEIDGKWLMAGSFAKGANPSQHKSRFEEVKFTPIKEFQKQQVHGEQTFLENVCSRFIHK